LHSSFFAFLGGSVNGGQIVGEYPDDFTVEGPWTLDRGKSTCVLVLDWYLSIFFCCEGRIIPTTPWEIPFAAVARWLGIESSSDIEQVCPNLRNFDSMSLTDPESVMSNALTIPTMAPTSSSKPSWISDSPSAIPSSSLRPSLKGSVAESLKPTNLGSSDSSDTPSNMRSGPPSSSVAPSMNPTDLESSKPSFIPSLRPSLTPSMIPKLSDKPSLTPSSAPSLAPLENAALKKPTIQSSDASSTQVSSKAVDGNMGNIARTTWETDPFWQVNLKAKYKIRTIKLTLNEWKLGRFKSYKVKINDGGTKLWQYNYKGTPPSSTVVLDVPENISAGNKVRVFLKGSSRQLELREVEVMGVKV